MKVGDIMSTFNERYDNIVVEEKSRLTPEEKERQYRTLKQLGYDPKDGTIDDKTGGRIKLNIDRSNSSDASTNTRYSSKENQDKIKAAKDLRTKVRETKEPNDLGLYPKIGGNYITSKLPKKMVNGKMQVDWKALKDIKDTAKKAEVEDIKRHGNPKHAEPYSITVNQRDLQDDTKVNHELGEVNNKKKQRDIANGVDNEKTRAYKDAHDKAKKEVRKHPLSLNSHDRNPDEILADGFMKKHSKHSDANDRLNGRIHQDIIRKQKAYRKDVRDEMKEFNKDMKDVRQKAFLRDSVAYAGSAALQGGFNGFASADKAASRLVEARDKKSADVRKDVSDKVYNKTNLKAFEKVIDLILENTDLELDLAEKLYSEAYERYILESVE